MKLKIKKFSPATQLKTDATVLLIGRRGSGKSTLMGDLMYHMRDKLNFGIAMSPTEESNSAFGRFVPQTCIYNQFSGAALDVMLEIQRKAVKRNKYKNVYLVMDDCMYDKKVMRGVNIRELFMNGRHRKIFHMNAVQYLMDMSPDIRAQIDFVFALKENNVSTREKLWKFFFGVFQNFADFDIVVKNCTRGYDAIVLDNTIHKDSDNAIVDCVFWYRADPTIPTTFEVGDSVFWDLSRQFYRDREEETDPAEVLGVGETADAKKGIHEVQKADRHGRVMTVVSARNSYTGRSAW
jgi:energy-coupling factor transporter ATP-binding protein EcfA2